MNLFFFICAALACLLTGCRSERIQDHLDITMQEIMGRDDDEGERFPVYRVKTPNNWIRHDPSPNTSLVDTKKSLCEFIIMQGDDLIRISVHNFPTPIASSRIPPAAQTMRWQNQFDTIDLAKSQTIPQAFNGYTGLLYSGIGILKEVPSMILGWALQLPPEHFRSLSRSKTPEENRLYRQMRADVTIKATGPEHLVEMHKKTIIRFARTFELIREIPART